jgi:CBS domain-containing protein
MTLSLILTRKGRDVVTTSPHRTLREVAKTLSDMGIGAILVVSPERHLLGIISERDIVRAVARNAHDVLDEPVSAHMTPRVITATGETSIAEAMGFMTDGRFRHVPVMDGDRVDGVVSIGDLVKHRLSEMETENKAMLDYISAA